MWNNILDWKLKSGSHEFPGPDGGTCINEAAIVAAGFEYKAVASAADCPPCFSRVIATYALRLNDDMPDYLRQELLMPFVVRLAGTADTQEVEKLRAVHIAVQTVRRILPIPLRAAGLEVNARDCESAVGLAQVEKAARLAGRAAYAAAHAAAYAVHAAAVHAVHAAAADAYADAAADAAHAAYAAAHAAYAASKKQVFSIAAAILDEAICLGNQGGELDRALVVGRMEAIKTKHREIEKTG